MKIDPYNVLNSNDLATRVLHTKLVNFYFQTLCASSPSLKYVFFGVRYLHLN